MMSANETHSQLVSEELAYKIQEVFHYVILPFISVLGIVGNVTSIVLLTRRGFRKCSNILLMALSVSDVLYLVGINNIPEFIYFPNFPTSFRFTETINYVRYIFYLTFSCAFTIGIQSAMVIPALITGERILAIMCPLKVYFILTPRRTMYIISLVYIFSALYFVYKYMLRFDFSQIVAKNVTLGDLEYFDVHKSELRGRLYGLISTIVNYMSGIVPICLVAIGCALIGTQITLITKRRKKLTSRHAQITKKTFSLKTTKTLLSICLLYVFCSGYAFVVGYVTDLKPIDQDLPLETVLMTVQDFILCINSVGDFIIYVGANKGFRKSLSVRFQFKVCVTTEYFARPRPISLL